MAILAHAEGFRDLEIRVATRAPGKASGANWQCGHECNIAQARAAGGTFRAAVGCSSDTAPYAGAATDDASCKTGPSTRSGHHLTAANGLPHPAQTGGEMWTAPAVRTAISTTRGVGERPSPSRAGLSSDAWTRRRRLARPPATPRTVRSILARSKPGSAAVSRSTMTPTGSAGIATRRVRRWSSLIWGSPDASVGA